MFDWQDLRFFLVVARLGSLTASARELNCDHATVGRRVARLEKALGRKLISRLPRCTRLTPEGVKLAELAAAMERHSQQIERHINSTGDQFSGSVTISALPAFAALIIAPSLCDFARRHPSLHLNLQATSAIASLERGEADIAVGFVRPQQAGRIVKKLALLEFQLYGPTVDRVPEKCVEEWPLIGFEESLNDIEQQSWLNGFSAGRPFALRSNDVMTQIKAVQAGVGAALLPRILGEREGLMAIKTSISTPQRPLWMSVHADLRPSPRVRAVMNHLVALFAADPARDS